MRLGLGASGERTASLIHRMDRRAGPLVTEDFQQLYRWDDFQKKAELTLDYVKPGVHYWVKTGYLELDRPSVRMSCSHSALFGVSSDNCLKSGTATTAVHPM